jgi:hypothetical protein
MMTCLITFEANVRLEIRTSTIRVYNRLFEYRKLRQWPVFETLERPQTAATDYRNDAADTGYEELSHTLKDSVLLL